MAYSNDNSYDLMGIFEFIIYIIHETNLCDNYCDSPPPLTSYRNADF